MGLGENIQYKSKWHNTGRTGGKVICVKADNFKMGDGTGIS